MSDNRVRVLDIADAAESYFRAKFAWEYARGTNHHMLYPTYQAFKDAEWTLAMLLGPDGTITRDGVTYRARDGRIEADAGECPTEDADHA